MTGSESNVLKVALDYAKRGFSVIPVRRNKRPIVKWERYQHERATPEQIYSWWKSHPKAGVGIVTGRISGLVVVDVDGEKGSESSAELIPDLMETPTARTQSGGIHYYFQWPGHEISNAVALKPGIDFRGDGGCVVAPPSKGQNGNRYQW
ncbi:bifunctional DNA primase/polymerase, partial [candidate division KSB1 bacterium]